MENGKVYYILAFEPEGNSFGGMKREKASRDLDQETAVILAQKATMIVKWSMIKPQDRNLLSVAIQARITALSWVQIGPSSMMGTGTRLERFPALLHPQYKKRGTDHGLWERMKALRAETIKLPVSLPDMAKRVRIWPRTMTHYTMS